MSQNPIDIKILFQVKLKVNLFPKLGPSPAPSTVGAGSWPSAALLASAAPSSPAAWTTTTNSSISAPNAGGLSNGITGWMERMLHRRRKETKQQPGTAGPGSILGCCLVSLRILDTFLIIFLFNANEFPPRAIIGYHEPDRNGRGILIVVMIVGFCLNTAYIIIVFRQYEKLSLLCSANLNN